jgi:bifunctional isochorismate lyase/aryl carrier protein
MTTCEAFSHDIETFLVADAVADFSADHHRMALEYAARSCAVVVTTDGVLADLAVPS